MEVEYALVFGARAKLNVLIVNILYNDFKKS